MHNIAITEPFLRYLEMESRVLIIIGVKWQNVDLPSGETIGIRSPFPFKNGWIATEYAPSKGILLPPPCDYVLYPPHPKALEKSLDDRDSAIFNYKMFIRSFFELDPSDSHIRTINASLIVSDLSERPSYLDSHKEMMMALASKNTAVIEAIHDARKAQEDKR